MAVRIALGAGRFRIIRQLLTESLLLAFLGAAFGLLFATWGERTLISFFPGGSVVPRLDRTSVDLWVLGFAVLVALVTGIAFGLAPALQLSRPNLNETLKEASRSTESGWRRLSFRGLLIVAETALSLILLAGAGLMIRSFVRLIEVRPGFQAENVLTVQLPAPSYVASAGPRQVFEARQATVYRDIVTRVSALPGLNATALVSVLPLGPVETHTTVGVEGDAAPNDDRRAQFRGVSAGYFRAMGIPLLKGRVFGDADTSGAPGVVIVSDAMARRIWPNEDPVGKHINMMGRPTGPWLTVVGVVGGIRHRRLTDEPDPELYRPFLQYLGPAFGAALVLRGERDPSSLTAAIRHEIRLLNPGQPIGDVKLMTQVVAESISLPRFYTALLASFAVLALLLAAAGIYGVLSYSVAQRTREVGIRMALGATRRNVLKLILGQGLGLVLIGVTFGVAGALALTRVIRAQLYATSPTDPATFAAVSGVLLGVAMAAAYLPARRAAGVDPMIALRDE